MQICIKTNGPDLVITNCLAPHTWASGGITKEDAYEIRQVYFQLFTEMLFEQKEKNFHLVLGDLNTRLHAQLNNETDIIGKYIFGRGEKFVKNLPQHDKEQRMLLIAALRASDHIHMNSQFEKPDTKKITRTDWLNVGPPYTPNRYAELDAVLSNRRLRNGIKNVESDMNTAYPSDHFPVTVKIKIKLAKNRNPQKDESNTWKSPKKPTTEQAARFNEQIRSDMTKPTQPVTHSSNKDTINEHNARHNYYHNSQHYNLNHNLNHNRNHDLNNVHTHNG